VKANLVWRRKTILRALSLFAASAIIAGLVSASGIIRELGSFRASLLTGSAGGAYHTLASRLADHPRRIMEQSPFYRLDGQRKLVAFSPHEFAARRVYPSTKVAFALDPIGDQYAGWIDACRLPFNLSDDVSCGLMSSA
jgi:hypothetical protein